MNFESAFLLVIGHEGGYVNHQKPRVNAII